MQVDEQTVIERLRIAVKAAGGIRAFARACNITPSYVHDMLHGRRPPAAKAVLDVLGVERVVVHEVFYQERPQR